MSFRTVTVIVPAEHLAEANQMAAGFDPGDGTKSFNVGLSPDGAEPVTHYICGVQMTSRTLEAVKAQAPDWAIIVEDRWPLDVAAEVRLKRVVPLEEWAG